jgi:hypothetical protein
VKNAWTMNVEFYTGVDERLDVPMILPPVPSSSSCESARMLIADDVADTGETLKLVRISAPARSPRCVRSALREAAVGVKCEYVWRRTDRWIDFPWSAEAPGRRAAFTQPLSVPAAPAGVRARPPERPGEVESLAENTADPEERCGLDRSLDTLGDDGQLKGLGEVDDRLDERALRRPGVDRVHERAVDLHRPHGQVA